MFAKRGIDVKSLLDFPDVPDVEETGSTFAENARLKAEAISRRFGCPVIADDSGLVVDALGGRPGVYSARYAGEDKNDARNIAKLLHELEGVPMEQRTARFHCALAVAIPGRPTAVVEAACEGYIAEAPRGEGGFGYDPVFYLPEKGKTMAELTPEEKNEISHRAKALAKLDEQWDDIMGGEGRTE
nr:XTP/dITP diphosphatase [Geobacillus sp. DSP4a]